MTDATSQAAKKQTFLEAFIAGQNKGLKISATSMLPNVIMAYIVIYILNTTGLLDIIGFVFKPIMRLAGLPGEGAAILLSALLSGVGASGVAASLYTAGKLTAEHCVIALPGICLATGAVQYLGRILGVTDIESKYYGILPVINIIVGFIGMVLMNLVMKLL